MNEAFMLEKGMEAGVRELRGGVLYEVLSEGADGPKAGPRSVVTCHYKGSLISGRTFDDSFARKCPEAFRVNDLISGFQIALVNMRVGDRWRVYIPWEKGYGNRGVGTQIPGYSTLVFEIQLIAIG